MSNKNLLSGRDKELQELAEQYELAMSWTQTIWLTLPTGMAPKRIMTRL